MTKSKRIIPANLSVQQKAELKEAILKEYPNLVSFESDLEFLINEYSKNKSFVDNLMKTADPLSFVKETEDFGEISTYSKDDKEYDILVKKFEDARKADEEKRKEIDKKAEIERLSK